MTVTINGTDGIETNTDTGKIKVGADDDLQIWHDGSDAYISKTTADGRLQIKGDGIQLKSGSNNFIHCDESGVVEISHSGTKKFETTSGGASVTGHLLPGAADTYDLGANTTPWRNIWMENDLYIEDNGMAVFGTGEDFKIRHTGSTNVIRCDNGYELHINKADTENMAKFIPDGAVELYYNNTKRFATTTEGTATTGLVHGHRAVSDSDYPNGEWHIFSSDNNNNTAMIVEHSGDTNPYGIFIDFSDTSPDNHTHYFINAQDGGNTTRFTVYSDGDVWTSDDSYLSSDSTLKENIVDATSKLEDLKKLKVRNFNWKASHHPEKSKKKQLGFIAQEVEEVFPALIEEHDIAAGLPDDGHTPIMKKAIKQAWSPIIIKAMQELIAKVETLETEVNTLKTKVAALEAA